MPWTTRSRPTPRLRAAVKTAYSIFEKYQPGPQLATCRCPKCMDDETERQLLSTPVRQIGLKLLSEYTWSASGSNNRKFSADEMRHFLPCYFHFIAYGLIPNYSGDWQPALRQLGELKYRETWPVHEVESIDEFFAALLSRELEKPLPWTTRADGSPMAYSDVDDLLSSIAYAGGSMEKLLHEWSEHHDDKSIYHAACIVNFCERGSALVRMRFELPGPYWDNHREQALTIRQWLFRPEIAAAIETAIRPDTSDDLRELLLRAHDAVLTDPGMAHEAP